MAKRTGTGVCTAGVLVGVAALCTATVCFVLAADGNGTFWPGMLSLAVAMMLFLLVGIRERVEDMWEASTQTQDPQRADEPK